MDAEDHKYFKDSNVTFQGGEYFSKPIYNYLKDPRLSPKIVEKCEKIGYLKPTPIQAISIPMVLDGKDFIGKCRLFLFGHGGMFTY